VTVDYPLWGIATCNEWCQKISDTDQLNSMLIDSWAQLSQDILNRAIDQLLKNWWWLSRSRILMLNYVGT